MSQDDLQSRKRRSRASEDRLRTDIEEQVRSAIEMNQRLSGGIGVLILVIVLIVLLLVLT